MGKALIGLLAAGAVLALAMGSSSASTLQDELDAEPVEGELDADAETPASAVADTAPPPAPEMTEAEASVYQSALLSYNHEAIEKAAADLEDRGWEEQSDALYTLAHLLQTMDRFDFANYVDQVLEMIAAANPQFELPELLTVRRWRLVLDDQGRVAYEFGETFDISPTKNEFEVFLDSELVPEAA